MLSFKSFLKESVKIDNAEGLGQVPFNQDVDYRGFKTKMKPSQFLNVAHKIAHPKKDSIEHISKHLKSGGAIGAPFLDIDVPDHWREGPPREGDVARVRGHEGRHRMMAVQAVHGDVPVETHMFVRTKSGSKLGSKHLTDAHKQAIHNALKSEEGVVMKKNLSEATKLQQAKLRKLRRTHYIHEPTGTHIIQSDDGKWNTYAPDQNDANEPNLARPTSYKHKTQWDAADHARDKAYFARKNKLQEAVSIKLGAPKGGNTDAFMDEYHQTTSSHPFSDHDRVFNNEATTHVYPNSGRIHIGDIRSLKPKSGAGTRVLKHLQGLADKHGVELEGTAKAYAGKNSAGYVTKSSVLKKWYGKHGFNVGKGNEYDGYPIRYKKKD